MHSTPEVQIYQENLRTFFFTTYSESFINAILPIQIFNGLNMASKKGNNP